MLSINTIKSYAITICQGKSTIWRKVTENVFSKGQANNMLPSYIRVDDVICMNCYNGIVINSSIEFQRHAQEQYRFEDISEANKADDFLFFSQVVKVLTDILYTRENREKKPMIYSFDEFREIMEGENIRLKSFFDKLYFSSSLSTKNKNSQIRDLTMYLDFTGVSDTTLDTLFDLGTTITSRSITRYKSDAFKEHYRLVNATLTQHIEKAM
ncbi:11241_t:CDS:2, partial [Acaulospora morrowiae]